LLAGFGGLYRNVKAQVQLAQVKVVPFLVRYRAFHGTRLRHAFPILDAADLLQELGYSLTIGDRSVWLDCLGARWIQGSQGAVPF
jgi:hypothetical protein